MDFKGFRGCSLYRYIPIPHHKIFQHCPAAVLLPNAALTPSSYVVCCLPSTKELRYHLATRCDLNFNNPLPLNLFQQKPSPSTQYASKTQGRCGRRFFYLLISLDMLTDNTIFIGTAAIATTSAATKRSRPATPAVDVDSSDEYSDDEEIESIEEGRAISSPSLPSSAGND